MFSFLVFSQDEHSNVIVSHAPKKSVGYTWTTFTYRRIGSAGNSDKLLYWPIEGRWLQLLVVFRSMNSDDDSWWWVSHRIV